MAGPIEKTMQVLGSTANPRSLEVLIAALDIDQTDIQQSAVNTLIKRKSSRGQLEIIRRVPRLHETVRESLESQIDRISGSLRQALLHGDAELRAHGLELLRATENFELIPALLEMLKDNRAEITDLAAETMRDLIDRLYEHSHSGKGSRRPGRYLRNVAQINHNVLSGFDRALSEYSELSHQRDVVEAVMILGEPDNFAVKKALVQSGGECRQMTSVVLMTGKHPGVMQLALDYMSKNYPPPKVFEVVTSRDDPEFIAHFLRWFPKRLTPQQQRNFQQVQSVAWIDADRPSFEGLSPALQPALVDFVSASGLASDVKLRVQEWVVHHGTREGRLAAANMLGMMDDAVVQEIVTNGLDSQDEEIQAWATGQLRSQEVPEALTLLVDRLDSPLPAVRDAAREELKGFDVATMLDMFENISPETCLRAGQLIRKIDPDCFDKLRQELESPIRSRRIRAARGAHLLGMQTELQSSLLLLLDDNDPLIRRTGISALTAVRTPELIQALVGLLEDENPRVREEASRALSSLQTAQ
jgi:HEAT repeat protein